MDIVVDSDDGVPMSGTQRLVYSTISWHEVPQLEENRLP